jgi:hypothetical protein
MRLKTEGDAGGFEEGAAKPPSEIGCVEGRPSDEVDDVCDADFGGIVGSDMFNGGGRCSVYSFSAVSN